MVSKDGGKTWCSQVFILGFSTVHLAWSSGPLPTQPGWRATSVLAKDHAILTLYTRGSYFYGGGMALPRGEHMQPGEKGKAILSVRWALDGLRKPPLGTPTGVKLIAKPSADGYLDNNRCRIKPELLNWGGDYFSYEEILCYERLPAENHFIGPGGPAVVSFDPNGNVIVGGNRVYRSQDAGRTWESTGEVPDSPSGRDRKVQSFGVLRDGVMGIIELSDGTALMTCGNLYLKGGEAVDYDLPWDGIYRSRDGGKTWGDFSFISHPACETNLLWLRSGRMMASIRIQGTRATDDFLTLDPHGYRTTLIKNCGVAFSDDKGYTWTPPQTVTRYNECPGNLAEMSDGTVVMTFCQKNNPNGARAVISRDQGRTWDPTHYMVAWCEVSGVFPNSIVLKDGRILTVTARYSPSEMEHVLEAKMWKPLARK